MATLGRLPLAATMTTRGIAATYPATGKDGRLIRCIPVGDDNPVLRKTELYVEKIPGFAVSSSPAGSVIGTAIFNSNNIGTVSAFGATNSTIYLGTTSAGTITGIAYHITDAVISGAGYVLITSSDTTGWYLASDATTSTTYTADGNNSTTITDIKISGINSVAGLYVGQKLSAASNIVSGSRIVSINSAAFSAVLSTATTGGSFNDLSITKEPVAKIIDTNFPAIIGPMIMMDGWIFALRSDQRFIYQSALNSLSTWSGYFIAGNTMNGGSPVAIQKSGNRLVMFTTAGTMFFFNAGNASGSVLSEIKSAATSVSIMGTSSGTAPKTFAKLVNKVIFVSTEPGMGRQLYVLNGDSMQPVQSQELSLVLKEFNTIAWVSGLNIAGDDWAYIFGTANDSSSIEMMVNLRNGYVCQPGFPHRFIFADSETTPQALCVSQNDATGKIYTLSAASPVYQDDSVAYTATMQISDEGFGTGNRKTIAFYELICDTQSSGTATLEYSDDDGQNYSTLGTFDLTQIPKRIYRGGSYKEHRMLRVTNSSNTPFRARALVVDGVIEKQ